MKQRFRRKTEGFSLIELMIALVLGVFLIGGVIQVFLSNKTNYRFTEALTRLQENGRFALETMARDIRMAGYFGCASQMPQGTVSNNLNHSDGDPYDFLGNQPLSGTDNDGPNGSDTLALIGAVGGSIGIRGTPSTPAAALLVPQDTGINQSDILIVSDCTSSDIFQVTNSNPDSGSVGHNTGNTVSPGNADQSLQRIYGPGAEVIKTDNIVYSIADGFNNTPALFRTVNGDPQQLIGGLQDMQILHGEDRSGNGQADVYVPADQVTAFAGVVSVRVSLLLRSESPNVVDDPQVIRFNGADQTIPDRRLAQEFTSTVAVRNRAP